MFRSSKRCLRELRELLNEALHHLADLQGQFSSGRDHQGTNLRRVAEMIPSEWTGTPFPRRRLQQRFRALLNPDSHLHLLQLLLSLQKQFNDGNDESQRLSTAGHLQTSWWLQGGGINDYVITDWGDDELSDGYEDSLQLGMS